MRIWNGLGRNPWPRSTETTVAGNACENCHVPHNAGIHERLLRQPEAEDNCLVCHNGSVAAKNVAADFNKLSVHPVAATASFHDAAEDPVPRKRHVSCVDCHNPHAANSTSSARPNVGGALAGVMGVNLNGVPVSSVTREYELCFRCHSDSVGTSSSTILRQTAEPNLRRQFNPANASYHPVVSAGKGGQSPSLIAPWTTGSLLNCTDCHNSDSSPAAGGSGANGPHGSQFAPLLERQLDLVDFDSENSGTYALCYKCHSRDSILSDQSFKGHREHVLDEKTACTTCHDPHGVANAPHLINFNQLYVKPASNGRLEYTGTGSCTLSCHGKDHLNSSY
jgi:predicted CXXCH cytochrome family protein